MIILFPKKKGVKIATTLIFKEIAKGSHPLFILGMIYFANKIGAITEKEMSGLTEYLWERGE